MPIPVWKDTTQIVSEPSPFDAKIPLFLGNESRRYYGKGPIPEKLKILWKKYIGGGKTKVSGKVKEMYGTGWPGQSVLVEEDGSLYLLLGSFDYNLRKVNAVTGKTIWKHKFNNIIKGTPTIYINENAKSDKERYIVLCGSRRGPLETDCADNNYRAISLKTGEELWSFVVPLTNCYSRDAESNGLIINGLLYFPAENGVLYVIDPNPENASFSSGIKQPKILSENVLFNISDINKHNKNIVVESSPSKLDDIIYITAGSGHVYGIDINTNYKVWDFYVGSDLDGSPVVTKSGHLFVTVEKQYISGKGGVYKLDPKKNSEDAVCWYFPTQDRKLADWQGGVIGSVGINDDYNPADDKPALAAIGALDGHVYVVSQDETNEEKCIGPDGYKKYSTPKLVWKEDIAGTISTPIFIDNYMVVGGYSGNIIIYKIDYEEANDKIDDMSKCFANKSGKKWKINIRESGRIALGGCIESTPIVWNKRIYIGDRSGYFYCIGEDLSEDLRATTGKLGRHE
ncbi:MAG: hypothetical protein A2252_07835 [Elusimicrobia bacterium RIFOXYA2_FULL_39_19]|nr:MAG: hypothetical protein A2252_07835 [Elusimicrobia bacterium RIFOXYA2_FULL_39_19]